MQSDFAHICVEIFDFVNARFSYRLGEKLLNEIYNFANNKIYIHITKKLTKPIVIEYNFDRDNKNLINDIKIEAEENTKAQILIKYVGKDNKFYHNGLIKIKVKNGSDVKIDVVNLLSRDSNNFTSYDNIIENNAKIKYTLIELSGKNIISNWYVKASGKASK